MNEWMNILRHVNVLEDKYKSLKLQQGFQIEVAVGKSCYRMVSWHCYYNWLVCGAL